MSLFITFGDIIGIILLLSVLGYLFYAFVWDKVDTAKKRKPYHTKEKTEAKKEIEPPKSKEKFTLSDFWRAFWPFIIFVAIFGVLIALLILTSK